MEQTNILIHGLHWSGSSALLDLLREYEEITIVPHEFDEFRRIGMIGDTLNGYITEDAPDTILEEHIRTKREQLGRTGWFYYFNPINIKSVFKYGTHYRRKYKVQHLKSIENLYKSFENLNSHFERIDTTRTWIQKIGEIYSQRKNPRFVVFDHAIDRFQHRDLWPQIFTPFKLLIVYRDPRDQLANLIKVDQLFLEFGFPRRSNPSVAPTHGENVQAVHGRGRSAAITFFSEAMKRKYEACRQLFEQHGPDRVLLINFESLVRKYATHKKIIEQFIGLSEADHNSPFHYFNPDHSVKNIGYYQKFLNRNDSRQLSELLEEYEQLKIDYPVLAGSTS